MAERVRGHDWSATPLGPIESWPGSLTTIVAMLLAAPNPVVLLWGPDGVLIYNDGYARFAGERHPALLGQPHAEGWPEIADYNDEVMRQVLGGASITLRDQELSLDRGHGLEPAWMDLDYAPVRDERGRPAGVIVFVTETTEKRLAEQRQAETNERLELTLSAGRGVGTWDWDIQKDRVRADARFAQLYGVDPEAARLGAPLAEFFRSMHPDDAARVGEEVARSVKALGPFHAEYRLLQADGSVRWVVAEGRVISDETGKAARLPGVSFDITERRHTDAALAETEIRYDALFGSTSTGFCIVQMKFDEEMRPCDYKIVEGNPAFEAMTGLKNPNGKWVSEIAPGLEQHWFDLYGKVALTGEPVRFENPADIFNRWYDVEALRIGAPEERRVAILFTNITERKQRERRQALLIELNDALRNLTEPDEILETAARIVGEGLGAARVGYGRVDPADGSLIIEKDWTAPGVPSLAGLKSLSGYGSLVDALRDGEAVQVSDVRMDARTAGLAEALEARSTRAFLNIPIMEQGQLVAVYFINESEVHDWSPEKVQLLRDIAERVRLTTERARSDAELRRKGEELLRLNDQLEQLLAGSKAERDRLWTLSTDALARADYSGDLLAVNPAWTRILGWTEEELLTTPYARIINPENLPETTDALEEMGRTGRPTRFENRILSKDGRWRPIGWTVAPEPDGVHFIAVGRDLTEDKAREQQLVAAQEALRQSQKMEAVGQLTGGIAHDFNNLLAGISGSLELLSKRLTEGRLNGMERYIDAAQGSAQRAASLTQRLLAFSRRQTLDPKPTDVNRLIAGMEELIRRSVGPDVEVEVVGAGGLWTTRIDQSQLENALLNLCINGRDAMAPDGGRLTIETSNKWLDDRAAKDRELPPGQYVALCVTDTGSGMSPEVQGQAFDPFFTTKPLGQGTGLGLSMIHGFVRQSGGQVRIYSEIGKGTTMCLYLPRSLDGVEAESALDAAAIAEGGHGETVLVIDDEETVRMLVAEVLGEAGYTVIEAPDGPLGLEILRSDRRIDLLISDVGLPGGMNGRQVADAARETRPDLKVLFITGYAENAAVGNGLLAPGMEVLTKPFVMGDLAAKVHDMIEAPAPEFTPR
jgi:PAS domain S-box-containing protein